MRSILRMIVIAIVAIGFIGLLGASVRPDSSDDESDEDGPSYYALQRHVTVPISAIAVQLALIK